MDISPLSRRLALAALAVASLISPSLACSASVDRSAGPKASDHRGVLISAERLPTLSADRIRRANSRSPELARHVHEGVIRYKVRYRTVDPAGEPIEATGLAALPASKDRATSLLSYTHGTLVYKGDAPSNSGAEDLPIVPAASGFIVSAPDYLGLGGGSGTHPYLDKRTETSASIDMLKATTHLAKMKGYTVGRGVQVVGFSQGARVALSLTRAIESGKAGALTVSHVAAISGPFDLQHSIAGIFKTGNIAEPAAVYYLAYWTVAMNRLYHLYGDPSEAFVDPAIEKLFDGTHEENDVFAKLPPTLDKALTKDYQNRLQHPDGAILKAMHASDGTCASATIQAPIRLYYSPKDVVVDPLNSASCLAQLKKAGDEAVAIPLKTPDHLRTASEAMPAILTWLTAA